MIKRRAELSLASQSLFLETASKSQTRQVIKNQNLGLLFSQWAERRKRKRCLNHPRKSQRSREEIESAKTKDLNLILKRRSERRVPLQRMKSRSPRSREEERARRMSFFDLRATLKKIDIPKDHQGKGDLLLITREIMRDTGMKGMLLHAMLQDQALMIEIEATATTDLLVAIPTTEG
jgi:hypothetical protein